jgi:hypothetical protein
MAQGNISMQRGELLNHVLDTIIVLTVTNNMNLG